MDTALRPPPARGRPRGGDGSDTRRRILDAALEGFARQGYAATSIRQIARAVGIRESAIYAHFESKRAIFEALLAASGPAMLSDALQRATRGSAPPGALLPQLVDRVMAAWETSEARTFVSFLMQEGGSASPLVADALGAAVAEAEGHVGGLFERWMGEGLMRADFPVEHLAWEFMAPIALLRLHHLHAGAGDTSRRLARRLARRHVEWFLACTRPPEPPPAGVVRPRPSPAGLAPEA